MVILDRQKLHLFIIDPHIDFSKFAKIKYLHTMVLYITQNKADRRPPPKPNFFRNVILEGAIQIIILTNSIHLVIIFNNVNQLALDKHASNMSLYFHNYF